MKRRSFIQKGGLLGITMASMPNSLWAMQEIEYSIQELTGKVDIDLFGEGINLRKEAHDAFIKMKQAAYQAGVDLKIVSSYRNFYRQEAIWERKYTQFTEIDGLSPLDAIEKIITYSTIPGTSRHHWGTDIDIIDGYGKTTGDVLVPGKFEEGGPFENFKNWMDENSEEFGFYLVYTNEPKRKGFKYEPWHYSYASISKPMLATFRSKNISQILQHEDISGREHFTAGFLKSYIHNNILDINPELL